MWKPLQKTAGELPERAARLVAYLHAEATDIFQAWTALTEMKIENAGPEPTLNIQFSERHENCPWKWEVFGFAILNKEMSLRTAIFS